jgi:hypothetical protein
VFFQIQRTTIVTHIVYISVAKGTQQTMPVDPFSIAGVFGLAAGLIGFTVSTIEKSAGQLNTARQAHQRLRGHWEALKTCQQRLEAWERQWYDHEKLEQDDLNFLWDREGVQAVDSKRAVLLDEQGELLKLLYNGEGSESRSRETSSWWSKVFRDLDMAMRSGVPGPDPPSDGKLKDFSIRVAMALWTERLGGRSGENLSLVFPQSPEEHRPDHTTVSRRSRGTHTATAPHATPDRSSSVCLSRRSSSK